jgi:hypothetical protein
MPAPFNIVGIVGCFALQLEGESLLLGPGAYITCEPLQTAPIFSMYEQPGQPANLKRRTNSSWPTCPALAGVSSGQSCRDPSSKTSVLSAETSLRPKFAGFLHRQIWQDLSANLSRA